MAEEVHGHKKQYRQQVKRHNCWNETDVWVKLDSSFRMKFEVDAPVIK